MIENEDRTLNDEKEIYEELRKWYKILNIEGLRSKIEELVDSSTYFIIKIFKFQNFGWLR